MIETKEVTIAPAKAASLLKRHQLLVEGDDGKKNRRLKQTAIDRYARDMASGAWKLNGETIKIGYDGRIIDGQHRLSACVQANVPFKTLLCEGVVDDAYQTIDAGVPRSMGDALYIAQHPQAAVLSSALVALWRWEQGHCKQFAEWGRSPTRPEQFDVLARHPGLEEFVSKSGPLREFMPQGLGATMWYLFAQRDSVLADAFFDALVTGLNMKAGDPVYSLRERLMKDRARRPRPSPEQYADFVVRVWAATRKGRQLTKLNAKHSDTKRGSMGRRGLRAI